MNGGVRLSLPAPVPLLLALWLAACGGSPATPSTPSAPPSATPALQPGGYDLTVSSSRPVAPVPVPGVPIAFASLCSSSGPYPETVRVPVTLERHGSSGYRALSANGSLVLDFSIRGEAVSGRLEGKAEAEADGLWLSAAGAELSGLVAGERSAAGAVTSGHVTLGGLSGYGSCSNQAWHLLPH
jgi:hypothetical protein